MQRRALLKALGAVIPGLAAAPILNTHGTRERGRVKITDVKVMRVRIRGHEVPLVKVETDAGCTASASVVTTSRAWERRMSF